MRSVKIQEPRNLIPSNVWEDRGDKFFIEAEMSIAELLPTLRSLSRADKLKIMQFLVQELAAEEEALPLQPGATYQLWSPFNSHEAAQKLATLLEENS